MTINETKISIGRYYRHCVDKATKAWERISFWTKSSDIELENGKKLGSNNNLQNGLLDSLDAINANTVAGNVAGALALKELNNNLGGLEFGQTDDGKWGYKPIGADSVIPFKNNSTTGLKKANLVSGTLSGSYVTLTPGIWVCAHTHYYTDRNSFACSNSNGSILYTKNQYSAYGNEWGYLYTAIVKVEGGNTNLISNAGETAKFDGICIKIDDFSSGVDTTNVVTGHVPDIILRKGLWVIANGHYYPGQKYPVSPTNESSSVCYLPYGVDKGGYGGNYFGNTYLTIIEVNDELTQLTTIGNTGEKQKVPCVCYKLL